MRDYDYHPDEDTVRCFGIPSRGVVISDVRTCVYQTRAQDVYQTMAEDLVLRHYAFADQWFKLNATFDLVGRLIEPGPPGDPFAVNCDISTPMVRLGEDISAVDLFLDVLVRCDGSYRVVDRDEFEEAASAGLISSAEAQSAEVGLVRLIDWIESGRLWSLLDQIEPGVASLAPSPLPFERTPLADVASVRAGRRNTR